MNRELDGVYFRIERDGKFQSICFSDLTNEEMHKVLENKSNEWLEALKEIGETFNIVREQVNQMTREEAIKILRSKIRTDSFDESFEEIMMDCALTMAIADMEKQIPKKPKKEDDFDYGDAYVCQVCGTFIAYENILSGCCKVNYCTECGNEILWGEEND